MPPRPLQTSAQSSRQPVQNSAVCHADGNYYYVNIHPHSWILWVMKSIILRSGFQSWSAPCLLPAGFALGCVKQKRDFVNSGVAAASYA
jgi:hypothetical protein